MIFTTTFRKNGAQLNQEVRLEQDMSVSCPAKILSMYINLKEEKSEIVKFFRLLK